MIEFSKARDAPALSLARSVVLGLTIVTTTYILVNVSFLLVLTPQEIKSSEVDLLLTPSIF